MRRAISYIRFSTKIQKHGDSETRQTDLINNFLKSNPDVVLSDLHFSDLGRSGYHASHLKHGLGRLITAIEEDLINSGDIILVENIDRLSRQDALNATKLITSILEAGVTIVTLSDNQTYTAESLNGGQYYILVGKIQAAFSHSNELSKKLKSAWRGKNELAEQGVTINRKTPWWITKDDKGVYSVVTDEDKALLTEIFTLFISGVSYNKLIERLREERPEQFSKVSSGSIKKWMLNTNAIGQWNDAKGVYPAAVEESLFYSAQKEMVRRRGSLKRGVATNHILAGIIKCAHCGSNYSLRQHKHSSHTAYCTVANKDKTRCNNTGSIPLQIFNEFRVATQTPYILKIVNSEMESDSNKKLVVINGKIENTQNSIDNLMDLALNSKRQSPTLAKKLDKLEEEMEQLEIDKAGITQVDNTNLTFANVKLRGLDLIEDTVALNGMLKKIGYVINAKGKDMWIDNTKWKYIRYIDGQYEILMDGSVEMLNKAKGTTELEKVAQLVTK